MCRWLAAVLWCMAGLLASPHAQAACGDGLPAATRHDVRSKDVVLVFASTAGPITVGKHFSLEVRLCSKADTSSKNTKLRLLKVDADMPAHRHGMNYRASVRVLGEGRYRADGLMLHMPGVWRFSFDVEMGTGTPPLRLTHEMLLE